MNCNKFRAYFIIFLISVIPSFAFWGIFHLNLPAKIGYPNITLKTIFANYDGPNYMVVAKCGYVKDCIRTHFSLPNKLEYYPAHLPGYPALISLFNLLLPGPVAMLLVTLIGTLIVNFAFFKLASEIINQKNAYFLTAAFTIFPGRWFILHQIGAPETLFVGFCLWSIIFFRQRKYLLAALAAVAVQLIKSPGIILAGSYFLLALYELIGEKKAFVLVAKKYAPFLLVPLAGLGIFYIYYLQTGDFFAYFHSGDNIHLTLLPFTSLISSQSWVNGIWLEDIIYIFFLGLYGCARLWGKYKWNILSLFPILFLTASLFVAHRDISRYVAPIYPFLFLAFAPHLKTKAFRFALIIIIPAILLYAINFVIGNTAPIADWTPYL